jgi:hypothetical protein
MNMPNIDKESQKELIKEAIKEWLSEQAAEFGWWTLKCIGMAAFAGIIYLALISQGWKK